MENHLAFVTFGDYYSVKKCLEEIFSFLNIDKPAITENSNQPYFEPLHSAIFRFQGEEVAVFGEIRSKVLKKFKLTDKISAFEIDLNKLLALPKNLSKTFNLSKFPSVSRDLTFKADDKVRYSDLEDDIKTILTAENLIFKLSPVSIYVPKDEKNTKNISFHLAFSDPKKTLDSTEISAIIEKVTKKLNDNYGVEVI